MSGVSITLKFINDFNPHSQIESSGESNNVEILLMSFSVKILRPPLIILSNSISVIIGIVHSLYIKLYCSYQSLGQSR